MILIACEFTWLFIFMFFGPIAQVVEHCADNAGVSGSSPDGPTRFPGSYQEARKLISGGVAQLGEHHTCTVGVVGSNPSTSTI